MIITSDAVYNNPDDAINIALAINPCITNNASTILRTDDVAGRSRNDTCVHSEYYIIDTSKVGTASRIDNICIPYVSDTVQDFAGTILLIVDVACTIRTIVCIVFACTIHIDESVIK